MATSCGATGIVNHRPTLIIASPLANILHKYLVLSLIYNPVFQYWVGIEGFHSYVMDFSLIRRDSEVFARLSYSDALNTQAVRWLFLTRSQKNKNDLLTKPMRNAVVRCLIKWFAYIYKVAKSV